MFVEKTISNLYAFLKSTDADEIVVRTSRVRGGWDDNATDAGLVGFSIVRFQNEELLAKHEFAECYRLTCR